MVNRLIVGNLKLKTMLRIIKQMNFYIAVVIFGFALAFMTPTMVECKKQEQSTTILRVVRHPDTTFSVIMQDKAYDALNELELDSIINTLQKNELIKLQR